MGIGSAQPFARDLSQRAPIGVGEPDAALAFKQPPYEYEYELLPFDILCGTDQIRKTMESGRSLMELADSWVSEVERFRHLREPFLLY